MTNAERGTGCGDRDHERCPRCDPGLLDDLKCKAEGIQKQAEYNAAHFDELEAARKAYNEARAAYNTARSEAKSPVAEARRQLEELEDRVRCQLDSCDVECIDTAFGRVVERLNRCGHARGCCCDEDCDHDDEVRDCDPDDVPGRLAVIEHRTKEAADCFWSLIGEHTVPTPPAATPPAATPPAATPPAATPPAATPPAATPPAATPPAATPPAATPPAATPPAPAAAPATPSDTPLAALPARVKALQDEIAAISKAAADGLWDSAKLYAAALVARRHLRDVWRGFDDVNDYMECLCRALTCMIKGHAAIGELTRQAAVNECHRESRKAACEHLEHHTVEEVLAEYLRVCAEADDDDRHRDDDDDRRRHRDDDDRHRDDDDDRRRHRDDDDRHRDDDDDRHRDDDDDRRRHRDDDDRRRDDDDDRRRHRDDDDRHRDDDDRRRDDDDDRRRHRDDDDRRRDDDDDRRRHRDDDGRTQLPRQRDGKGRFVR